MPEISIIIPAYNSEKVIGHCINSLLKQSFKNLEIIIVNDGSQDNTLKVCNKFSKKDNRVKVISKENEGRSIARRTGYFLAQGKYIAFVDHDDYLPKDAIYKLYNSITKYQVDCVIGNRARVYSDIPLLLKIDDYISITEHIIEKDKLWKECYGMSENFNVDDNLPGLVWGRLFRKSCIDEAISTDSKHLFSNSTLEDWWFTLMLLPFIKSIYAINDIVYYWRVGGQSSGDYPLLENSDGYFNFRYEKFYSFKGEDNNDLLMRTYVCFLKTLYWELTLKIYSNKYDINTIKSFISDQLSSQKIIKWAVKNQANIPNTIKTESDPIIQNKVDDILKIVIEKKGKKTINLKKNIKSILIRFCSILYKIYSSIKLK